MRGSVGGLFEKTQTPQKLFRHFYQQTGVINSDFYLVPTNERYTTATIKAGADSFTFPTKTQDEAMQFENAFNSYRQTLTTGPASKVYSLVADSREQSEIIEALNDLAKEETRLRELEKQREAEEKRRLEEERIAAEKAAEERKKAIIQRQRERNEERKREAEKLAEEKRRVVKLFDDDLEADTVNVAIDKADHATIPAQIVGNRLISNNVFKVTLKFVAEFRGESLIAYFVTNSGETISNKKKIPVTTDDIAIGFILRQHRTIHGLRLFHSLACIKSVIFYKFPSRRINYARENLFHLTNFLTAQLSKKNCAVVP